MNARLLGFVCAVVLVVILTLGLWPFHAPANDVSWLPNRHGLSFGRASVAFTSASIGVADSDKGAGASVEIWLQPGRIWDRGTFLAFCDPGNPYKLALRQSQLDLQLLTARDRNRLPRVGLLVPRIFPRNGPVFLTVASGASGTAVYVDGRLVQSLTRRLSAADFSGRLVLGDSPGQTDSWQGQVFGLAIYQRELGPGEVTSHFRAWTRNAEQAVLPARNLAALYTFAERSGPLIHNLAPGPALRIPERYTVVDKIFLEPFWKEFDWSRSYRESALQNVVGFLPVGFCFYPLFLALRFKRAKLAAVLTGTAISLTIEVLQAFLPTRDSGTTDLFTNTLGTWLGVVGYNALGLAMGGILKRAGLLPVVKSAGRDRC